MMLIVDVESVTSNTTGQRIASDDLILVRIDLGERILSMYFLIIIGYFLLIKYVLSRLGLPT